MNSPKIKITIKNGSLLEQNDVDALVNPWNRNFIPPFLFQPQGVSKALQKVTGKEPWKELSKIGLMETGQAVMTTGGKLPQNIIHVAGLNLFWTATDKSIQLAAQNAVQLAWENKLKAIAMPLIGSGVGNKSKKETLNLIHNQIGTFHSPTNTPDAMEVRLIIYGKQN